MALNESGGYWLVHSVPKYPPTLENNSVYDYPHTGQMYGQTFLCISLNTPTSADQIGLQMMYNQPYVYSTNVPKWVEQKYPNLSKAAHKKYIRKSPFHSMVSIKSFAGLTFTSFAKTEKFGKDLYADFVAPFLQTNLVRFGNLLIFLKVDMINQYKILLNTQNSVCIYMLLFLDG